MNSGFFFEKMKMADLVLTNYRLLYVFPCFGVGLGFGERTVKQICEQHGISSSLFLLVCNIHTFDDYVPDSDALAAIPLADLTEYLRASHKEYLERRLPKIIDRILDLVDSCHIRHGEILARVCEKYRLEVVAHFDYEEQTVFPYITTLLDGHKPDRYKIKEYESNHGDLDAALSDLKNIVIKYFPETVTIDMSRDVLIDLFLFESDLAKHTILENRILISLVESIENRD
jgi:regulator of cell morphogenesis and NO signaling